MAVIREISKNKAESTEAQLCSHPNRCKKHLKFNMLGAGVSFLCLLHCLMTPLVLGIFSTISHKLYHGIDYVFFAIALAVIVVVSRKSEHFWIKAFLWTGVALILTGLLLGHHQHHSTDWTLFAGSGFLVVAHVYNVIIHYFPGFYQKLLQNASITGFRSKGH